MATSFTRTNTNYLELIKAKLPTRATQLRNDRVRREWRPRPAHSSCIIKKDRKKNKFDTIHEANRTESLLFFGGFSPFLFMHI